MTSYNLIEHGFTGEQVDEFMAAGRDGIKEAAAEIRQWVAEGKDPRQIFMDEITAHSSLFMVIVELDSDAAFMSVFALATMAAFVLAESGDPVQTALDAQPETKARIDSFIADPTTGFTRDRDASPTPEA